MSKQNQLGHITRYIEFRQYQIDNYKNIIEILEEKPYAENEFVRFILERIERIDGRAYTPDQIKAQDLQVMLTELCELDTDATVEYQPECLKPVELKIPSSQKIEAVKVGITAVVVAPFLTLGWPLMALMGSARENQHNRELGFGGPASGFAVAANKGNVVSHEFEYHGIPFSDIKLSHPLLSVDNDKLFGLHKGVYLDKASMVNEGSQGYIRISAIRSFTNSPESVSVKLVVLNRHLPGPLKRISFLKYAIGMQSAQSIAGIREDLPSMALSQMKDVGLLLKGGLDRCGYIWSYVENRLKESQAALAKAKALLQPAKVDPDSNLLLSASKTDEVSDLLTMSHGK